MIYSTFAQFYDELFDEHLYLNWQKMVEQQVTPQQSILDLAGGAGRLAVLLAQDGYDVSVADFSSEMLSLAEQHAHAAKVTIPLIEANMLDLTELATFDVITCFADSLCYLDDLKQVENVFRQVRQHLNDGGRFIFDVITPYQTDEVYPGYMFNSEDEESARFFMWSSFQDDDREHAVIHDLTFFNEQDQGLYERTSETHHERTYELDEYLDALDRAGFTQITVSADFGRAEIQDDTPRWFFTCQQ